MTSAVIVSWSTFPASANLKDDIETAIEGEPIGVELTELDAATADIAQLTDYLRALNLQVNSAQSKNKKLLARREQSAKAVEELAQKISATETKIADLEVELANRAVRTFQQRTPSDSAVLGAEDATDSIRKQKLSESTHRNEAEVAEELRQAYSDLVAEQESTASIEQRLAKDRDANRAALTKFQNARRAVATLAQDAEKRAERVLAEADAIGELDAGQAQALRNDVKGLNTQVRIVLGPEVERKNQQSATSPQPGKSPTGSASKSDMRLVQGIWVHHSIADNVDALINAARADGIELGGGGFRDAAGQIAVRRSNCGTSAYAIYEMPSSSCRPPTARPGSSMHGQGLAIDFTVQGKLIKSRSNTGFAWLAANAGIYGLFNLPSEPWHWSSNGR